MKFNSLMVTVFGGSMFLLCSVAGAWSVSEDFDASANGSACTPLWDMNDTKVSSAMDSVGGGKSCRMGVTAGSVKFGTGLTIPTKLKSGDQLWIRFRLFAPNGFSTYVPPSHGSHLKFIRIDQYDPAGTPGRLDWYWPNRLILERGKNVPAWQILSPGHDLKTGVWETWEMYVKLDYTAANAGGQGRVRAWKNGVLIGDLPMQTLWDTNGEARQILLVTHWNGGAPQTQHLFLDDLVMTNVTPSSQDAAGNPYIGVGNFVSVAPPLPPNSIQ